MTEKHPYKVFASHSDTWTIASHEPSIEELHDSIIEELESFSKLEEGWSYGEGGPIPFKVIEIAKKVYKVGSYHINSVNVFPGTDGSILVVFYKEDISIEVVINKDLSLDLTLEKGIGFDYNILLEEYDVRLTRIENILRKYKNYEWMSSGFFTTDTMTRIPGDFEASHSKTPQMMAEYP